MSDPVTVLNVEDHAPTRFLRTRILERAGFAVTEVATAAEAVAKAREASVVLLDVRLPDGDGFDVCERVKAVRPTVPVVMISSVYRTAQARRDGFAMGADAFLLEPVEPQQLVRTIATLVQRMPVAATATDRWIVTDAAGQIVDLSTPAASLLNLSPRAARGRSLPTFITENRPRLLHELIRAAEGTIIDRETTLQPRDRKPVRVRIDISALPTAPGARIHLRWVLSIQTG